MQGKSNYIKTAGSIILLFISVIMVPGSCSNECQTCRKFEDKTARLLDELTACDDAMIQSLEAKGYYCR